MSFYDDASLVFLPSGEAGKDGKAYSMKPTNGNGDFTFSRGSNLTATRVDSNGLIEKGRENLLLQSNQFDTTWLQTSCSVTSGQSGYDGSSNAWLLSKNNSNGRLRQYITDTGVQTLSAYFKAGTNNWMRITYGGKTTYFDLSNGVLGSDNSIDANITSVGSGWYRCTFTANVTSAQYAQFYVADANGDTSGTSGSIYIQDAQLEIGLVATEYIESGATTGLAGLLEDSPRFDYSGGASCPSLLLEPSRTNLIEYSEYFEGTGWTAQAGITLTPNTTETLSPEGLNNAYKVVSTDATKGFYISGLNVTNDAVRTIYLKGSVGGETIVFKDPGGFGTPSSKTLTTDWQRFEMATTNDGNTYQGLFIDDISVGTIYAYGAQLEEGSYATSYIPNHSGGSVTRELDHCFTSSNSVLEEISATYFLELTPIQITSNNLLEVRANGSTNNRILLQTNSGGALRVLVRAQGSSVLDQNISGAVSSNTKVKIALKYTDRTNISVFVDGVKEIDSDLVIDFSPELNGLDLEGSATNNNDSLRQHQFLFFPTALSDSECITLTS